MGHEVLLWGTYYCDLIFTDLEGFPGLGREVFSRGFEILPGGCFTTALALHRLGIDAVWACDFGDDIFSRLVLQAVADTGINSELLRRHSHPVRRVTTAVSYSNDRAFISFADEVELTPIEDVIRKDPPRWLLLPHLHFGDAYRGLFTAARESGVRIFMDCQSTSATLDEQDVREALGSVDVFAPNSTEAMQLTGSVSPEAALAALAALTPLVVMKVGERGAIASQAGKITSQPGITTPVVDTTGAGDCFNAGFLYATLRKMPLTECLAVASYCGAISTSAFGGQAAPTRAQLVALMGEDLGGHLDAGGDTSNTALDG